MAEPRRKTKAQQAIDSYKARMPITFTKDEDDVEQREAEAALAEQRRKEEEERKKNFRPASSGQRKVSDFFKQQK